MKNMILEVEGEVVHHVHEGLLMCTQQAPAKGSIRTRKPAECEPCKAMAAKFRNPDFKGGFYK